MAVNLRESLWLPYKELYNVVYTAVFKRDCDIIPEFESVLKKHKPDLVALLRNPSRNAESREIVRKATTEGVPVAGHKVPQIISQAMVDEALILSDMFQLNEISALELLVAGEHQRTNFIGLTRGLVAVLLYYDGRQSLVASLRVLIQAREGRTWTLGLSNEMVALATKYTNQLQEEGIVRKILDLMTELDFGKEVDKLQRNLALGPPRHRKQVIDLIIETKQTLAECLYCWACQSAFSVQNTLQLLSFLTNHNPLGPDGSMENVSLALLMAMLYSIDVSIVEQAEDSEVFVQKLPILTDRAFVPSVHKELMSAVQWQCPQLKAVIQFAWAVTLRVLSQQPNTQALQEYFEEDEVMLDQAVSSGVFHFLYNVVLSNETFHLEEFYIKRIHNLITDFIIQMPLKLKELRNNGDEIARIIQAHEQEGLEPPQNFQRHFEHIMQTITALYAKDPLKLELILEYWCPVEMSSGFSTMYPYQLPQKQVNLFKFVRLAGDLLPPTLYVPYVQMLTSLSSSQQCAHHCFNMLKLNGASSGGHCSTVGWDHFFTSLHRYYANLRQELPVVSDTQHIYRQRPQMRGITPLELQGLTAVLRLIKTVAENDEIARVAMCENQQWLPVVVLLGLVGCSVSAQFKAELLSTLSAFAKTPAIAVNLWHSLEVAQILQTVKTTSTFRCNGIQTELDEIEARNEEFPMTRAFLGLLSVLVDVTIPATLGVGFRAPGFDPYFEFVRDSVFLKFNTRAYKNSGEKWSVAAACLTVFHKLLRNHEVVAEDFCNRIAEFQGGGATTANKRPGHNILVYMLHDSAMLKMILYIITESVRLLSQYTDFPGKDELQKCSLLCLKLISNVLVKQTRFLDLLRESGSPLLVSSIDKLLLSINTKSSNPDHLVYIARFVTFSSFLPEHALYVTKIFRVLCESPVVQPQLVPLFTMEEKKSNELLYGFVETLDSDENESFDQTAPIELDEDGESEAQIRQTTRQNIVKLLLTCLPQPQPNLAHFLLGFELRKPVSKTTLQEPGVIDSPRTCLHVILSHLAQGIDSRHGPYCIHDSPALAESYYHLIHNLCANKDTAGPTLRYLRTTHDFLYRQLQHLPFKTRDTDRSIRPDSFLLLQQAWILKSLAIELHMTSLYRQRSHVQRLVNVLVDDSPDVPRGMTSGEMMSEAEPPVSEISGTGFGQLRPSNIVATGLVRRKLLSILDIIDFNEKYPETPQWEYFDPTSVDHLITQCEHRTSTGLLTVDVQQLHQTLNAELNELQGSAALGQRPLISQEIQNILTWVVTRNKIRTNIHAKKQIFDAWRQVTEVILTAYPADVLEGERRQRVLFDVIQELLHKVLDEGSISELTCLVSGVVLTLLANLRQCFFAGGVGGEDLDKDYLTLLDGSSLVPEAGFVASTKSFHSSSLQVVLKGLIECITNSGVGPQRVRANYYAALLNFLRIAQKPKDFPSIESNVELQATMILDHEFEHEKLSRENMEIILSYGEHFMEIVCRDCCTNHDVTRMLTLACLDVIVSIDHNQHWLNYMISKGYLRVIIESLLHDNQQLQNVIISSSEPLRSLYIYESKMALLCRLALSVSGANGLLECGIMKALAGCTVFDMRPEQETSNLTNVSPAFQLGSSSGDDGFLVMAIGRYRQVLFPALRLCLAITTSLGQENRHVTAQVLKFVIAHVDVLCTILRERHLVLTLPALEELSLVARVVARATLTEIPDLDMASAIEVESQIKRLGRSMIALLQRYALTDSLQQHVTSVLPSGFIQNHVQVTILEILGGAISYCRSLVTVPSGDRRLSSIIFLPNLIEAVTKDTFTLKDFQVTLTVPRTPNIGIVVYLLQKSTDSLLNAYDIHKNYSKKLNSLSELSLDEMKEFLVNLSSAEKLSAHVRKQAARRCLLKLLAFKAQEVKLYSYLVENCLYLIWIHLEHFLVNCSPNIGFGANQSDMERKDFSMSAQDLNQLKADALLCVNETLFRKLQEIVRVYTRHSAHCSFMEALIRRLKRLVRLNTK